MAMTEEVKQYPEMPSAKWAKGPEPASDAEIQKYRERLVHGPFKHPTLVDTQNIGRCLDRIESDRAALASERKLRRELQGRVEILQGLCESAATLVILNKAALARAAEHDAETGKEESR